MAILKNNTDIFMQVKITIGTTERNIIYQAKIIFSSLAVKLLNNEVIMQGNLREIR